MFTDHEFGIFVIDNIFLVKNITAEKYVSVSFYKVEDTKNGFSGVWETYLYDGKISKNLMISRIII